MAQRILIVEDEPAIALALTTLLTAHGYQVVVATTAADALRLAEISPPELVVLDLGLPDADGKEIIAHLRGLAEGPIIVLSARHQEEEKVAALELGADDYVDKPFGVAELLARIRVALRRVSGSTADHVTFRSPELGIDFAQCKVYLLGEEIKLSPKEFALLHALARQAGQVVTRRRLLLAGWNDPTVDGQNLRTYIGLLRQKLEVDPSEPRLILTEPGIGYRVTAIPR